MRKRLKKREETPQINQVLKNTEMPQKFYGNASKKRGNTSTKQSFKSFFKKQKRLKKNGNASKKEEMPQQNKV